MLEALLWDVDGTLAETERDGHRVAFNEAFAEHGLPWRWSESEYGRLLEVSGGRERLLHDLAGRGVEEPRRAALAASLHEAKNRAYGRLVAAGGIGLRPGVRPLLEGALAAGLRLAIVTTTSGVNVAALLATALGTNWRERFAAVIAAEQAPRKKPDPEAYRLALEALGLAPGSTLAIEDAPAGLRAAASAGVPVILQRSYYFPEAPDQGTLAAGPSLGDTAGWRAPVRPAPGPVTLELLRAWHAAGAPR